MLGGEGAEDVFEEVGGYGGAVGGGGADVVDGVGFGGESGAGGAEGGVEVGGGQACVLESGFGGVAAGGAVGEGGCGEADGLDFLVFDEGEAGQGDFGDGLGVAGAYFADVVVVVGEGSGEGDGVEEFVGTEGGFFVGEVEVCVGDFSGAF